MLQLFLGALLAAAIVLALFVFVIGYSQRIVRGLVEDKHRDTELIENTRLAPPRWRSSIIVRLGGPTYRKRYALRRLQRLIVYFRTTSLVENDETRNLIVEELSRIREEWRAKTWKDICPYE